MVNLVGWSGLLRAKGCCAGWTKADQCLATQIVPKASRQVFTLSFTDDFNNIIQKRFFKQLCLSEFIVFIVLT